MGVANFRVKNGLYVVEDSGSSGNLTLLDGEIKSDNDLTVFPSATSGTNTAGNDMIVQGGAGTGSGAGGAIKFNVAGAGGSGSSANAQATKMQIASTGIVTMTDGTNASNTTSGTLIVTGGVGISQNLYANVARFTGSTASSSTTTGALVVTGGTGIGGDLYVGDDLRLASDSALLTFGANDDVILTHVADVGLQLSTTATSGAVPIFEIYQDETDANGGVLRFKKEAGSSNTADNDKLGVIQFFGDDDGGTSTNMGTIEGRIQDASNNDELGRLMLRPRADSGGAGGIIIDGLTVEGLLNKKHHISVAVGGNRSGDATGLVASGVGSTVTLFQAPADNSDKGAQHFAVNGSGSINAYTVIPAVNIGGGDVPRTFAATATSGGSPANYTTNLFVNGTGYTEARISSVLAQKESYLHPGMGSALVMETVDSQNFNGVYFSRSSDNALSWIDQDMSGDLGSEGTWGAGWLTAGTDFSIGFHGTKYDSCAITETGSTQVNPLVSGKSLFRITTAGLVGIKNAPTANVTLTVGASGETNVGGVIRIIQDSAAPATTTDRLYNDDGNLFWNGTNLSASAASALGDLSDVTYSTSGGSAGDLSITGLDTFTMSASDTVMKIIDTSASGTASGGLLTLGSDDSAVMADNHRLGVIDFVGAEDGSNTLSVGARIQAVCRDAWDGSNNDADLEFYTVDGTTVSKVLTLDADGDATFTGDVTISGNDLTFGNGATIVNTSSSVLTITEAQTNFSGDIQVGGNDIKASDGTTAITLSGADVTIAGDLNITGDVNSVSVTNLDVDDLTITLAKGAADSSAANNAGISIDGASASLLYSHSGTKFVMNKPLNLSGTTESSSATTGELIVAGGAGIAKDLSVGDDLRLTSDASVFSMGAGADITITHDNSTGGTLASAGAFIIDGEDDLTLDVGDGKDVLLLEAGTAYASIGQGSVDIANIGEASATTIDTFDCTAFQATKYLILVEDTTNTNYMSTEILVLGDENGASTAVGYLTQYAVLFNDTELGDFTVTGSSNNINLQYTAGNMSGTSQHKVRVVATRIASI